MTRLLKIMLYQPLIFLFVVFVLVWLVCGVFGWVFLLLFACLVFFQIVSPLKTQSFNFND